MSNKFISFYYDPIRQGYDPASWQLLTGNVPSVSSGYLAINVATIVHYGDCFRGDFTFNLNIPTAPTTGDSRTFGLYQYNKGQYIVFNIADNVFSAITSDGEGNTTSSTITWQSDWTATDTEFRIKWEAGTARFYVGGAQQTVISDISISGDSMSLYIQNANGDDLEMKYIDVKGVQAYYLNVEAATQPTITTMKVRPKADTIAITELVTTSSSGSVAGGLIQETLAISELVFAIQNEAKVVNDTLTVTELVTAFRVPHMANEIDTLTITESITIHEV